MGKIRNEWEEAKEAGREVGRFVRRHDWKKSARKSVRPRYWLYWLAGIVIIVAVGLLSYYHNTIVDKFQPHRQQILDFPVSWIFPTIILIILSFPPLGGQEIVLVVIGLIWGLGIGSAIAAAGTFLGELACFVVFRYFLSGRAAKIERKSVWYACLARLMRDGGFLVACMIRLSAVPGHVVTAMMSTCGVGVWIYSLAVIVSIPKQLAIVYLGVIYGIDKTKDPEKAREQKIISYAVFAVSCIFTVVALYYVYMKARKIYPQLLAERSDADESAEAERIAPGAFDDTSSPAFKPVATFDADSSPPRQANGGMSQYEGGYGRADYLPYQQQPSTGHYGAAQSSQPRTSHDADQANRPFYTPTTLPLPGEAGKNPFESSDSLPVQHQEQQYYAQHRARQ